MAALSGGQTWGLSGSNSAPAAAAGGPSDPGCGPGNGKKTVVLVKLTDAALRTLEDYVALRKRILQQRRQQQQQQRQQQASSSPASSTADLSAASIQFPHHGSQLGTISIPVGEHGKRADYSFSLSSLDQQDSASVPPPSSALSSTSSQQQGSSLECLATSEKGRLESIGSLQEKLQVKASVNDSYNTFEQKMQEVNQEKEKRTAQFLERGPSRVARVTSTAAASRRLHAAAQQPRRKAEQDAGAIGNGRRNHHSYPHHHHHLLSTANPELMRRPLKERIIHLLAVRPYKKPELFTRIARDGIHEKDKKNISGILKQVSVMKDNVYHLLRHLWNDVSEDWPFYSEQERQSFRRRKPQNLTPPCSDGSTSSSGHSPASTHPASPPHVAAAAAVVASASPPGKRGYGLDPASADGSSPSAKRRRVSNYVRPPDMKASPSQDYLAGSPGRQRTSPLHAHHQQRLGKSPLRSPGRLSPANGGGTLGQHHHPQHHLHHQRAVIQESKPSPPPASWQQQQQQHGATNKQQVDTVIATTTTTAEATSTSSPDRGGGGGGLGLGQVSESRRSDFRKDFAREFPPITSRGQRARYKEEFNSFYSRYRLLHARLDVVSRRFAALENKLRQEPVGTDTHRRLREKIRKEYTSNKQDGNFLKDKEDFQYLHEKLAYIKKLVSDYDVDHPKPV